MSVVELILSANRRLPICGSRRRDFSRCKCHPQIGRVRMQRCCNLSGIILLLVLALAAVPGHAGVTVRGDLATIHIAADGAPIAEVLDALRKEFGIRYDARVPLEGTISGNLKGTLGEILSRVLRGYNFILRNREDGVELVITGQSGPAPIVEAPRINASPDNKDPAAQWRQKAKHGQ